MTNTAARMLEIDSENAIHVIHQPPQDGRQTFVFFNSMGASTDVWEGKIVPMLRDAGCGTLSFDYRGQGETRFGPDAALTPAEIVSDARIVMEREAPARPSSRESTTAWPTRSKPCPRKARSVTWVAFPISLKARRPRWRIRPNGC